mgnify:CR=1 FL=1
MASKAVLSVRMAESITETTNAEVPSMAIGIQTATNHGFSVRLGMMIIYPFLPYQVNPKGFEKGVDNRTAWKFNRIQPLALDLPIYHLTKKANRPGKTYPAQPPQEPECTTAKVQRKTVCPPQVRDKEKRN